MSVSIFDISFSPERSEKASFQTPASLWDWRKTSAPTNRNLFHFSYLSLFVCFIGRSFEEDVCQAENRCKKQRGDSNTTQNHLGDRCVQYGDPYGAILLASPVLHFDMCNECFANTLLLTLGIWTGTIIVGAESVVSDQGVVL